MLSIPFVTIQSSSLRDLWEAEWTGREESICKGESIGKGEAILIGKRDQFIEKEMRLNGINTENKDKEKNKEKEQKQLENNIEGMYNGYRDKIGKQSEQGNY